MPSYSHEYYMQHAVHQARIALEKGEVPIGAIMVSENEIIARAYNMVECLNDATAHAEMLAMSSSFEHFGSKYLKNCTLYVTLEPCMMCMGASCWAQLGGIIYGSADPRSGGYSVYPHSIHPLTLVSGGILSIQCEDLLNSFFSRVRTK
jgi:tRNA(adenine34) deaminase